jgi:hypothetical protein
MSLTSRPLPDKTAFHDHRARQMTARAIKLWTRSGGLPPMPGWVVEGLVVHLDPNVSPAPPLDLFRKIVGWLQTSATPAVLEGVLKPLARPAWNPLWSAKLPGQIEAIQNHARALSRRKPQPEIWQSAADVGLWLGR